MVRLVYMTPSLEGLEGVDPNDEFENLEDLIRRAHLKDLEELLNRAVSYYLHFIEAQECGADHDGPVCSMMAKPYDSPNRYDLYDEEGENYFQVDEVNLDIESDMLDSLCVRAGLETVDELLKRSLILFEQVVQAREAGWHIGLYNRITDHTKWITDAPEIMQAPATNGPGKPTLQ